MYYASACVYRGCGKCTSIKLHKLLSGFERMHHKDGNGLNRESNFEKDVGGINARARRLDRSNKTGFRRVYFSRKSKKFGERFTAVASGRLGKYLGTFDSKTLAACVRDQAVREQHLPGSVFNFPHIYLKDGLFDETLGERTTGGSPSTSVRLPAGRVSDNAF